CSSRSSRSLPAVTTTASCTSTRWPTLSGWPLSRLDCDLRRQALRRHEEVGIGHQLLDLGPVDRANVEIEADPALMGEVFREEEPVWFGRDEFAVLARRRPSLQRDAAVAMVIDQVV